MNGKKKTVFSSTSIVGSAFLKKSDFSLIIQKLNNQIKYKDYKTLSNQLNIDSITLSKISRFEIIDKIDKEANDFVLKEFEISVYVYDYLVVDTINSLLENTVKMSEILKLKSAPTITKFIKLNKKIDEEIAQLELLKAKTTSLLTSESKFFISNFGSINESIIKLYEQQLILNEKIVQNIDYKVLEKFKANMNSSNKNLAKSGIIGAVSLLIIGTIFLVLNAFLKSI